MPTQFKVEPIKAELIDFLTHLELRSLPATKRKEVKDIITHLSSNQNSIRTSPAAEKQIYEFFDLFFSAYPSLTRQFLPSRNRSNPPQANKRGK